jgi:hypothetical protein
MLQSVDLTWYDKHKEVTFQELMFVANSYVLTWNLHGEKKQLRISCSLNGIELAMCETKVMSIKALPATLDS